MKVTVYNLGNTSNDKPNYLEDWITAWEKATGRSAPYDTVGGHVIYNGQKWIVPLTREQNNYDSNRPIEVEGNDLVPLEKARNIR